MTNLGNFGYKLLMAAMLLSYAGSPFHAHADDESDAAQAGGTYNAMQRVPTEGLEHPSTESVSLINQFLMQLLGMAAKLPGENWEEKVQKLDHFFNNNISGTPQAKMRLLQNAANQFNEALTPPDDSALGNAQLLQNLRVRFASSKNTLKQLQAVWPVITKVAGPDKYLNLEDARWTMMCMPNCEFYNLLSSLNSNTPSWEVMSKGIRCPRIFVNIVKRALAANGIAFQPPGAWRGQSRISYLQYSLATPYINSIVNRSLSQKLKVTKIDERRACSTALTHTELLQLINLGKDLKGKISRGELVLPVPSWLEIRFPYGIPVEALRQTIDALVGDADFSLSLRMRISEGTGNKVILDVY